MFASRLSRKFRFRWNWKRTEKGRNRARTNLIKQAAAVRKAIPRLEIRSELIVRMHILLLKLSVYPLTFGFPIALDSISFTRRLLCEQFQKTVDHHMTAGDNWDFNYLRVRSHFGPISNGVLFLKHLTTPFLYHNPQSAKTHYYLSTTPRTRVLLLWFVSFFLVATRCPHDSSTSAPNEKTIHNKKWNWTNDFSCAPKGERVFATTGNRSLYRNNLRRVEQQLAAPQPTMLAREREQTSLSDRRYAFKNTFCHVSYLVYLVFKSFFLLIL